MIQSLNIFEIPFIFVFALTITPTEKIAFKKMETRWMGNKNIFLVPFISYRVSIFILEENTFRKLIFEWETKYIIWYLFIIQNETHIFWLLEIEPKDLYSILSDPPTFLSIFVRCRLRYVYDQIKGAWINWQKMINLM